MNKYASAIFIICFSVVFCFFIASEASSAACADIPLSGNVTVTVNCVFSGDVNGVEQGNLIIEEGVILTINSGQTIVFNPGQSVAVNGRIALSTNGRLSVSYIWLKDVDNDEYFTVPVAARDEPTGGTRRSDTYFTVTRGWTNVDEIDEPDLDDNNACTDNAVTADARHCGIPDNVAGTCDPVELSCLSSCEGCDGTSLVGDYATTSGNVCSGGSWTTPSGSAYCDRTINCQNNACSASRYYRGCTIGNTTCTESNKISDTTWYATDNSAINETTNPKIYTSGTPSCNQTAKSCAAESCGGCSSCSCECQYHCCESEKYCESYHCSSGSCSVSDTWYEHCAWYGSNCAGVVCGGCSSCNAFTCCAHNSVKSCTNETCESGSCSLSDPYDVVCTPPSPCTPVTCSGNNPDCVSCYCCDISGQYGNACID